MNIRQKALEHRYSGLNPMQRQAVFQTQGPVLILAGAGSGKTTVLINRIQYMVEFGNAYHSNSAPLTQEQTQTLEDYISGKLEKTEQITPLIAHQPIRPWNILAITFTNKAAGELRERLTATLGEERAGEIQASTFHSLCMRILRRNIDKLGYTSNFTIYDTDDSLRVIKDGLRANNLDDKMYNPRSVLSVISKAKDAMKTPEDLLKETAGDYREHNIAKVYHYYQTTLKGANALDFDDIIVLTVDLFKNFPDVLEYYQNRYKYIMVDEYQDTNQTQYMLVSMLASRHQNLCVVGDDDQSIYKFRGATIENILSFEHQFSGATVIRLEQNYRSSQNILTAANNLISHNINRKGKNLWTDAGSGEKVSVVNLPDETLEARFIADNIMLSVEEGGSWNDNAVLYRMNAQSSAIEQALAQRAIPYRIIGGLRFYERKEIKDIVSYLNVLNNQNDDLRLVRIVNEPRRGIGATTVNNALEISANLGEPLYRVFNHAEEYAPLSRTSGAILEFCAMMNTLIEQVDELALDELFDLLLEKTGYMKALEAEGKEGITRIENVMELKSNILQYMDSTDEPTLAGFLEEISLYTDLDNYDGDNDVVILMTVHSAKGLEFPNVYIAGMEEGVFPGRNSMNFPEEIEEERRLAYVAITRAKKQLYITFAQRRMLFGQTHYGRQSRYIGELPPEVVEFAGSRLQPGEDAQPDINIRRADRNTSRSIGVGRTPKPAAPADIDVGDRVSHSVFGEGTVLSSRPMGGDILLEIDFGAKGNKKVMANFARLKKL